MCYNTMTNGHEDQASGESHGKNSPLVELAIHLINVESLSGQEQAMAVALRIWLEERGWIVKLQEVAPQKATVDGKIRHNVFARPHGSTDQSEGPRVLFNSHIDTVRHSAGVTTICSS